MAAITRLTRARIRLVFLVLLGVSPVATSSQSRTEEGRAVTHASVQTIFYAEDTSDFPNPERGFYRQLTPMWLGTVRTPLNAQALAQYRTEGISVLRAYYLIDEFRDSPLSADALTAIAADFSAVRAAGIKMIPRFAYNFPLSDPEMLAAIDAPLSRVLEHIQQLAPVLRDNADVIALVETGFVGAWGEWHHSSNQLINADQSVNAASRAIVQQLLSALPVRRMIALRYPSNKQEIFDSVPLTPQEAFSGADKARVGAHNDCFLANEIGGGTYTVPPNWMPAVEAQKTYLSLDNRFVPQEGETCADDAAAQPFIGCSNALADLARMRWSTINIEWHPGVITRWQNEGCLPEIRKRLGFRLRMSSAVLPSDVREGRSFSIRVDLLNSGFAAPYNPRGVELVLRHVMSGIVHRFPLNVDPRFWLGGENHVLNATVTLPQSVLAGSYQMLLNFPDPEPLLQARPEYSIRLANLGTWEPGTGFNNLLATLSVIAPAPFTDAVITSGVTPIRAVHIAELRSRIGALRTRLNLAPTSWTDASLTGTVVKAAHVAELRQALADVYTASSLTAPTYSDAPLIAGGLVKAVHIVELRAAVVALE